jgi:hypothetical protein
MRRFNIPGLLLTLAVILIGCEASTSTSAGPSVSGSGMGNTRSVRVGDEVVLRMPASRQTGAAKWRIAEFDSRMLSLTQRPRLEPAGEGAAQWTTRFVARTPGETEVVFRRTAVSSDAPGEVGERRRFRIRIR